MINQLIASELFHPHFKKSHPCKNSKVTCRPVDVCFDSAKKIIFMLNKFQTLQNFLIKNLCILKIVLKAVSQRSSHELSKNVRRFTRSWPVFILSQTWPLLSDFSICARSELNNTLWSYGVCSLKTEPAELPNGT